MSDIHETEGAPACSGGHAETAAEDCAGADACGCGHDHADSADGPFFTPVNTFGIALFAFGFCAEHFLAVPRWLPLAVLLAAYLIIGRSVLAQAGRNLAHGKVFDENFLMCVASIGAFVIGEYPEAVAVMLFYMIGEYYQDKAVGHSRRSIRALMDIRPDTAWVVVESSGGAANEDAGVASCAAADGGGVSPVADGGGGGDEGGVAREVPAADVAVGQIIEIRPGGRVPLDAVVVRGSGDIDMKALTGETVPVDVAPGDTLLAGAVNGRALLRARVTKPFAESTASKIIELAQNAAERKAPAENFITKFARVYTPIVVCSAAGLAVLPPLFGAGAWQDWIMRGLVFLVVSCPCALVISIPVSYFGGIGAASARGILVKGGNYLDTLGKIGAVVFDKTGTLTKGRFRVAEVRPAGGFSADELVMYAAAAESASTHPIAVSIAEYARSGGMRTGDRAGSVSAVASESAGGGAAYAPMPASEARRAADAARETGGTVRVAIPAAVDIEEKAGYGVAATVEGRRVLCGNAVYMGSEGVSCAVACDGNTWVQATGTVAHVAVDGVYAGYLVVADEVKPDSGATVTALKSRGIGRIVMLTGDSAEVAGAVGAALGIGEVHAGLLPQRKVELLEGIIAGGVVDSDCVAGSAARGSGAGRAAGPVAVVGDGINDAPMLARADVGIAMGGLGSDAAVEAADVVIMNDAPSRIPVAIDIARKTKHIVLQNIVLALGIKGAVLILAAFGLANMWEAVFADVGVALLAVLNAMRAGR